jgi:hypothetical protein
MQPVSMVRCLWVTRQLDLLLASAWAGVAPDRAPSPSDVAS